MLGHDKSVGPNQSPSSCADSSHFWLNEGWTTYLERILQSKIHGPAERDFSYIIGRKALDNALAEYNNKPRYQRLVIDFAFGEDPDDAYSSVPYEKGSNFLLYLGELDVTVLSHCLNYF
jgi:leukotriene-A4 hydrolase